MAFTRSSISTSMTRQRNLATSTAWDGSVILKLNSNEHIPLLIKEVDKLTKLCPTIHTSNARENGWILKKGGQAKTLKPAKRTSKTIKKAHAKDKIEEESSNKRFKESATDPTKKNMCSLSGHNHLWKDCPNNPNSKKYNGTHYILQGLKTRTRSYAR